ERERTSAENSLLTSPRTTRAERRGLPEVAERSDACRLLMFGPPYGLAPTSQGSPTPPEGGQYRTAPTPTRAARALGTPAGFSRHLHGPAARSRTSSPRTDLRRIPGADLPRRRRKAGSPHSATLRSAKPASFG